MKKVILFLSMALCVAVCSCTQSDETSVAEASTMEQTSDSQAWEQLFEQQKQLNETYKGHTTRGEKWRKFWKKVKACICADAKKAGELIVAGIETAAIGGGIASLVEAFSNEQKVDSIKMARIQSSVNYQLPLVSSQETVLRVNRQSSPIDSIGYMHNKMIVDVFNANPSTFYTNHIYTDSLVYDMCGVYASVTGLSQTDLYDLMDSAGIIDSLKAEGVKQFENPTAPVDLIPIDEIDGYLGYLATYMIGLEEIDTITELRTYTDDTIRLVSESGLKNDEKEQIYASIIVAYASAQLWMSYIKMVEPEVDSIVGF